MKVCIKFTITHEDTLTCNLDVLRYFPSKKFWVIFGSGRIILPWLCFACLFVFFFYKEENYFDYNGQDFSFVFDSVFAALYSGGNALAVYGVLQFKRSRVLGILRYVAKESAIEARERILTFEDDFFKLDYGEGVKKAFYSDVTLIRTFGRTLAVYVKGEVFLIGPRYIKNHDLIDYLPADKIKVMEKIYNEV